jgi:ATP-dependent Lon protease
MSVYEEKLEYFKKVIDDIAKGLNYYSGLQIMTYNEHNNAFSALEKTINIINSINYENIIDELQYINNSISSIIKNYGCYSFEDIINICLASNFTEKNFTNDLNLSDKYKLLVKHLHPLNYNIINWTATSQATNANAKANAKTISKLKIIDEKTLLECDCLECFDLARTNTNFIIKVHGIKVIIHDSKNQKTLVINCLCDDLLALNNSNKFIINKKESIAKYITANGLSTSNYYNADLWNNFLNNYSLKELLIYSPCDLYNKYSASVNQIAVYSQKTLEMLVQDFISFDLYNQRAMLIQLLLINNKADNLYIAYILYDILSNDKSASVNDQIKIYNSLNWNCKKHLKNALQKTVEYTNELLNFETAKIPLEQSIYFMKANINVKEKALQKLKEIKSKSEDTGSKARQYLDGLLKIPFAIYKEEEILKIKYEISSLLNSIINPLKDSNFLLLSANRDISNILTTIHSMKNNNNIININIIEKISANKVVITNELLMLIAEYIEHNKKKITAQFLKSLKLTLTPSDYDKKLFLKANLLAFVKSLYLNPNNINNINKINKINELTINELLLFFKEHICSDYYDYLFSIEKHINQINRKNGEIIAYMNDFNNILDSAVYGHKKAKLQIERIVGQWINGESSGYCFGFEGLPGIGKTSLAQKGLAHCLKDKNNKPRPFSLIALGGSSNGSILEGHNYTYVGSTWGKIVDILMEHKCMNPIIFIDELDKVSKTEHGKELIGILTHLVDSTQNTHFQDKYFSNIDLDLSKVLFIFSYNDVELLDKILLDRIHRIKFDILTLDDKLIIARDYLLPELYAKFHFADILIFEEQELRFIIEHYTNESGVRKLKEVLFEIISSLNLMLLKNNKCYELPFKITSDFIEDLLRDRFKISYLTIVSEPKVGIINGLWANSYGNSGIIHIESSFFHSTNFLELKLTGLQGDIMKESNAVAKTLAFNLLNSAEKSAITKELEKSKMQGIHIHVPEGATPKDGPSAGAAITLVLYSLLSKRKIRNNIAITGEICLQGNITAIGGLDLKILGGLRAGVTTFYYPKANAKDYKLFYEKYEKNMSKIKFVELENIEQAISEIII